MADRRDAHRHRLGGLSWILFGIPGTTSWLYFIYLYVGLQWLPALVGVGFLMALVWFWPLKGWVEIGEERLVGYMGHHSWVVARLEEVEGALSVNTSRGEESAAGNGVHLLLRMDSGDRLRVRRLRFADEEAFLADLAAADPYLVTAPGRVVRVPPSAMEEAGG